MRTQLKDAIFNAIPGGIISDAATGERVADILLDAVMGEMARQMTVIADSAVPPAIKTALTILHDLRREDPEDTHVTRLIDHLGAVILGLNATRQAIAGAFPHFANDEPVTPEAIKALGVEYQQLVTDPGPRTIVFADQNGNQRTLTWEDGEDGGGFAISEAEGWKAINAEATTAMVDAVRDMGDHGDLDDVDFVKACFKVMWDEA